MRPIRTEYDIIDANSSLLRETRLPRIVVESVHLHTVLHEVDPHAQPPPRLQRHGDVKQPRPP